MFKANAVYKTKQKEKFKDAGFDILVDIEPQSNNILSDSMEQMFDYIKNKKCDGFIIDLGDSKLHFIKG